MQSHQKKIGNYYLLKPIGVGSFAKVYKGLEEKTSEIVAIKMINKQQFPSEKSDLIEKEVQILKSLSHPNIISILDIKKTQNNIYLIFEYCQMGDLESYIKKCYWDSSKNRAIVPEIVVQRIIGQLSEAFKVMNEKNIVHRDLKLANILVSKDFVIKLADFGFAKFVENNLLLQSYCGTPITMAPEILKRKQYNQKCDIWSLGIIIYRMLFGEYPFFPGANGSLEDLIDVIEKRTVQFPMGIAVSEEVKELIRVMLVIDPGKRIGFEEFFENLWVKNAKNENKKAENELQEALKSVYVSKKEKITEKPREKPNEIAQKTTEKPSKVQIIAEIPVFNEKITSEILIKDPTEDAKIPENRLSFMHLKLRNLLRSKIYDLLKDINDSKQISEYFLRHKQNKCAFLILMFMLNKLRTMLSHKIELKLSESLLIYQFHEIFGSISKEIKALFKEYFNKTEKLYREIDWKADIHEKLDWNQMIFYEFLDLCKKTVFSLILPLFF